jgi:hypothetical protein
MRRRFTVEWMPFQAAAGVDEATMLKASRAVQFEFLDRQDGFIRRELLKGPGDTWFDLLYWETREAAEQALRNAATSPACSRYFELIAPAGADGPAAWMLHLEQVESYSQGPR